MVDYRMVDYHMVDYHTVGYHMVDYRMVDYHMVGGLSTLIGAEQLCHKVRSCSYIRKSMIIINFIHLDQEGVPSFNDVELPL